MSTPPRTKNGIGNTIPDTPDKNSNISQNSNSIPISGNSQIHHSRSSSSSAQSAEDFPENVNNTTSNQTNQAQSSNNNSTSTSDTSNDKVMSKESTSISPTSPSTSPPSTQVPGLSHSPIRLAPTRSYLTRGKEKEINEFISQTTQDKQQDKPSQPDGSKPVKKKKKGSKSKATRPSSPANGFSHDTQGEEKKQIDHQPSITEHIVKKEQTKEPSTMTSTQSPTVEENNDIRNREREPVRDLTPIPEKKNDNPPSRSLTEKPNLNNATEAMKTDSLVVPKRRTSVQRSRSRQRTSSRTSSRTRTLSRTRNKVQARSDNSTKGGALKHTSSVVRESKKSTMNTNETALITVSKNSANNLFRRELDREIARQKNKIVLPAPTLRKTTVPQVKVIQQARQSNHFTMQLSQVNPFIPEMGRCIWREEYTHQYGAVVAQLTFQALLQIDELLYPSDQRPLNVGQLEVVCNILNGIPNSVITTLKRKKTLTKKVNNQANKPGTTPRNGTSDEDKLRRIIRTNSLYISEMGFDRERENINITKDDDHKENEYMEEIITNNKIQSVLTNLHIEGGNVFYQHIKSLSKIDNEPNHNNTQENDNSNNELVNANRIAKPTSEPIIHDLPQNEKQSVERLISRGNLSQAAKKLKDCTMVSSALDYDEEKAYQVLCSLHDDKTNMDSLIVEVSPDELIETKNYVVNNMEMFKGILDSLNKRSAADAAGWSVSLISNIISRQPAIAHLIMRMINGMLIHQHWPDFLFDCRIIGIPKPNDPGKYRPITITSTWRKIVSKAILRIHSQTLLSAVHPHQYGVAKTYGLESIVTTLQASLDCAKESSQPLVITQLDLSNAYNLVNRCKMLNILKGIGLHSSALYYFSSMFAKERLFFYGANQVRLVPNTRGISQGEACSPMLFSLY